jgi:hypothetical protein
MEAAERRPSAFLSRRRNTLRGRLCCLYGASLPETPRNIPAIFPEEKAGFWFLVLPSLVLSILVLSILVLSILILSSMVLSNVVSDARASVAR